VIKKKKKKQETITRKLKARSSMKRQHMGEGKVQAQIRWLLNLVGVGEKKEVPRGGVSVRCLTEHGFAVRQRLAVAEEQARIHQRNTNGVDHDHGDGVPYEDLEAPSVGK